MRHLFAAIMIILLALGAAAQSVQQRGIAYRYNGKKARTPLGNVRIKPAATPNSAVSDSATGTFTLIFNRLGLGDKIGDVRVTKRGMMIFNQETVKEWSVRRDPLVLILCDVDEFQRQKKNLIAIGEQQAKKKYDAQLAALEKELADKKIENEAYYNRIDSLDKEYQNALKNMDAYADVFARIDESEVDTVAQRAIELFNQGEIEESIRLFESGNYMKRLDDALRTKEHAQQLRQAADSAETLADSDIELAKRSLAAQISAYKLQNDWAKAGDLLKSLADRINTFDALWVYAYYCQAQNNFNEAETYFLKAESLLTDTSEDKVKAAEIKNSLAVLYSDTQRYSESENIYNAALEIYNRLAKDNPAAFEPDLAMTQMDLAILYTETQRYAESENLYNEALEILKRLATDNPAAYEPHLAMTQMNLAILYKHTQQYAESENLYKEALGIFQRLVIDNPDAYEPKLATTLMNLANLYRRTQRYDESESLYKEGLQIFKRLAKDNRDAYEPSLAMSLIALANLYSDTQRYAESEDLYKAALEIYQRLAKDNPAAFEPGLANTQMKLAILYSDTQRYTESENMYNAALEIRKRLALDNPAAFEPDLANTQENLAILYGVTQRYAESSELYESALQIYDRLAKENPSIYEMDMLNIKFTLVLLYMVLEEYQKAYSLNRELLPRLKELSSKDPDKWKAKYESCLEKQSFIVSMLEQTQEGE